MKIAILGTGDLSKIPRHSKTTTKVLNELIEEIASLLVKKDCEIVIIPDRGIPTEIAKIYKEKGGKKVIGLIPTKDKKFGDRHIQPFLKLLDEKIEYDHWYDVDGEIAASGNLCIVLGLSPGILRELRVLKYHYRYLDCKTKVVWFENTISQKMQNEIVEEIPIQYIKSVSELEKIIDSWDM